MQRVVAIGGVLVAVRGALIDVAGCLVELSAGLVGIRRGLVAVGKGLLLCAVRGWLRAFRNGVSTGAALLDSVRVLGPETRQEHE